MYVRFWFTWKLFIFPGGDCASLQFIITSQSRCKCKAGVVFGILLSFESLLPVLFSNRGESWSTGHLEDKVWFCDNTGITPILPMINVSQFAKCFQLHLLMSPCLGKMGLSFLLVTSWRGGKQVLKSLGNSSRSTWLGVKTSGLWLCPGISSLLQNPLVPRKNLHRATKDHESGWKWFPGHTHLPEEQGPYLLRKQFHGIRDETRPALPQTAGSFPQNP